MAINSIINFCKGYNVQQTQRFPKEDVQFYASHYYYRRMVLTSVTGISIIAGVVTFAQKFFKPLCFFNSSALIAKMIFGHLKSSPKEIMPLEAYEKRLQSEEDDGLKKTKLHVIRLIKTLVPAKKLPRISFSTDQSSWNPEYNAINISKKDLENKSTEVLEAMVVHEIGHCYHADERLQLVFSVFTDFVRLSTSYTNNIPLMFFVNSVCCLSQALFKSFREKEADRFAITQLNLGAKKTILSLKENVGLDNDYDGLWTWRGYNTQESILLSAAMSDKGIIYSHPTEYQRITWAMQQLKTPEAKTNIFKEFYRFLSTAFYGDLQLLKECENIKPCE